MALANLGLDLGLMRLNLVAGSPAIAIWERFL